MLIKVISMYYQSSAAYNKYLLNGDTINKNPTGMSKRETPENGKNLNFGMKYPAYSSKKY